MPTNWSLHAQIGSRGAWENITDDMQHALLRAGYTSAIDIWARVQPATFDVRLANDTGRYSGEFHSGPFVELRETGSLVWRGRLASIDPNENARTARLVALGPWAELRTLRAGVPIQLQRRGGQIVHGILDRAGWPKSWRQIDAGDVLMPAYWTPEDQADALLDGVVIWEVGRCHESRDYKVAFESRLHRAAAAHSQAVAAMGDSAEEITISAFRKANDDAQLVNSIAVPVQHLATSDPRQVYELGGPLRIGAEGGGALLMRDGASYRLLRDDRSRILLARQSARIVVETGLGASQAVVWDQAVVNVTGNDSADGSGAAVPIPAGDVHLVPRSSNSATLTIRAQAATVFITGCTITAPVTSKTVVDVVEREDAASVHLNNGPSSPRRVTRWATSEALAHGYALELIDAFKEPGNALHVEFDLADGFEQEWRRWVSDRISVDTLPINQARVRGDYFIERLQLELLGSGLGRLGWDMSPASRGPAATVDLSDVFLYDRGRWNVDRAAG